MLLFLLQLYAAISSKSLSLFATMADSFMDLLSGFILMYAARASTKSNWFKYPSVRKKNNQILSHPSFNTLCYVCIPGLVRGFVDTQTINNRKQQTTAIFLATCPRVRCFLNELNVCKGF